MFDALSLMLANQLFMTTDAIVQEAKGWLCDCGFTPCNTPAAVALQIRTHYPHGIKGFLNDASALIDSPVCV